MVFQVSYTFRDSYIPPHCRKPRIREITDAAEVDVPDVCREEAPIAFTEDRAIKPLPLGMGWPWAIRYRARHGYRFNISWKTSQL